MKLITFMLVSGLLALATNTHAQKSHWEYNVDGLQYFPKLPATEHPEPLNRGKAKMLNLGQARQNDDWMKKFKVGREAFLIEGKVTLRQTVMPWRLFQPEMKPGEAYPLILFLHGMGEKGIDNIASFKHSQFLIFVQPEMQKKHPCFVLVPQHPASSNWGNLVIEQPSEVIRMTLGLIDLLEDRMPIDLTRLYVIGLSSGAHGVVDLSTLYPDVFAAGVAFSNPFSSPNLVRLRTTKQPTPVWFCHNEGDQDVVVQAAKQLPDQMASFGADTRVSVARDRAGHYSWSWGLFQPGLIEWIFDKQVPRNESWQSVIGRYPK